ncbi:leukotriene B4 receptor 1-like [Poecilia formosa]|uniref:leukotriene B4 receptor 1-like n=1 Tax=Poecilia formosa TaxID=48698 RepID=UPI0004441CBB|nr:PREDICTED: leukotriene B4 receptor 1-like [Poecilia formosa]
MEQLTSTVVNANFSTAGHLTPHPWNTSDLVTAAVLSICFLLGVSGNIAVLILKPNWQNMSSLSQSLMMNLAISDLLSLLTLPLWIYAYLFGWKFDLVPCKLLAYAVYCSIYASLLTVSGLNIQRYLVVVCQRRCQQVKGRTLLFMLWLVASILAIPALVVENLQKKQQWISCQAQYSSDAQWVTVLLTETVFGFICFILMAFSYVCLQRRVNQSAFFNNPQTARLLTSIIVSFFVLWAPYHLINVLGVAAICLKNNNLLNFCHETWSIFGAMTFINSCLNPLLYAFTSHKMCSFCRKTEELQQRFRNFQTEISTITETR